MVLRSKSAGPGAAGDLGTSVLSLRVRSLMAAAAVHALWHIWQTAPNSGWTGWASLGGVLTSNISLGRNAAGRLEAFVRAPTKPYGTSGRPDQAPGSIRGGKTSS